MRRRIKLYLPRCVRFCQNKTSEYCDFPSQCPYLLEELLDRSWLP
ncbi:hypothetical protein VL20_2391 [Microcystis panniformis FACHB-1757]|uniref:Uncharacterized protein n=1 Tax=Microcystis panniformis FACHB-1757 TaxID=1638788 RepID=A0A0K1S0J1_9CHRO|nr:hypothetical protein VL20_2391 [Microcystis panniformis FACHB-1757]